MAYMTNTAANSSSLLERAFAYSATFFEAAAERQAKRRVYRATFNELHALSNRELADLGLHRSQLRQVALEAAGLKG
ncbi:DUF1127 domain-containing protein [Sulfitobacter sp. D35]|uniref:DUF1127 domain-containing protein n=1 Tax=Sulfitobacter sp. D35 TaxID=3083252 RepID=UPI00296E2F82|nr:DUF1127 domain-containing protein [Sulfitobacter sp. D35]MDW4497440.1 DUF1127 domain-containing protein [Sulfitobacter sp. D35]